MHDSSDSTRVACAFCGEGIESTHEDPIALGVVEHWRPHDEDIDWMVYSHRGCFLSRLLTRGRRSKANCAVVLGGGWRQGGGTATGTNGHVVFLQRICTSASTLGSGGPW